MRRKRKRSAISSSRPSGGPPSPFATASKHRVRHPPPGRAACRWRSPSRWRSTARARLSQSSCGGPRSAVSGPAAGRFGRIRRAIAAHVDREDLEQRAVIISADMRSASQAWRIGLYSKNARFARAARSATLSRCSAGRRAARSDTSCSRPRDRPTAPERHIGVELPHICIEQVVRKRPAELLERLRNLRLRRRDHILPNRPVIERHSANRVVRIDRVAAGG